jgi:competence protein ComEA
VVVHVVGRVRRPGVVTLAPGARVAEAVAAAGGVAAGAAVQRINLARVLVDGEQLQVPGPDDPIPAPGPGSGSASGAGPGPGADQPVDLNTATEAELDRLPGVGPVTAARIIAWRREHRRFTRVEELAEVDGIGAKMLERLRPLVRV